MLESQILRLLLQPQHFRRFRRYVPEAALSTTGRTLMRALAKTHELHAESSAVAADSVVLVGLDGNPHWDQTQREAFAEAARRVFEGDELEVPETLVRTWVQREYAAKVAELSDRYVEKPESNYSSDLVDHVEDMRADLRAFSTPEKGELDATFGETLAALDINSTVTWRLNALNQSVGAPYPGFFAVFGGRPDGGKTVLLLSELAHLLPQYDDDAMAIIFNNESHGMVLRQRWMQAVIGRDITWCKQDPARADKLYRKAVGNRKVLIKNVHGMSIDQLHEYVDLYADKLKFITFDMASKLTGFEKRAGNSAERQLLIAGQLRAWATQVAPVITTNWASADAEGVDYIGLDQLYGSKTGLQGEAEVVVNVGYTRQPEDEGIRYLNVVKNKSLTCPEEGMRISQHMCTIRGDLVRMGNPGR